MQRLIARFLLLLALAGTFLPVVLQATATPLHACCRRMGVHRCTDSTTSDTPIVRDTGCCPHSRGHAVTTPQWALPQPSHLEISQQNVAARAADSQPVAPFAELLSSQSTRAPPAC